MNGLTNDEITIDTNVFEHMLDENSKFNESGHIQPLLAQLVKERILLCVDSADVIRGEYASEIGPIIRKASQTESQLEILRYLTEVNNHFKVSVDDKGPLMAAIKGVIKERKEKVDRYFVAVAFGRGKILVTNDEMHIVIGPKSEKKLGPRRQRLMRATKKDRCAGSEILLSIEAHNRLDESDM